MEKEKKQFEDAMKKRWYAACDRGHHFWAGDKKDSYQEARKDAKDHDDKNHDGKATAVVLSGV